MILKNLASFQWEEGFPGSDGTWEQFSLPSRKNNSIINLFPNTPYVCENFLRKGKTSKTRIFKDRGSEFWKRQEHEHTQRSHHLHVNFSHGENCHFVALLWGLWLKDRYFPHGWYKGTYPPAEFSQRYTDVS